MSKDHDQAPQSPSFNPKSFDHDTLSPYRELWIPPVGDCKGRLAARCDSGMESLIVELIQNPDTPFRNQSDFLRFSSDLGIQAVQAIMKDPRLADTMAKRRVITQQLQDEEEGRQVLEFADRIRNTIDSMMLEGAFAEARAKVDEIRKLAIGMKSPRWRKKTLDVLAKYKGMTK